jgi:DNA-binding NarL/FixJ family response regulator
VSGVVLLVEDETDTREMLARALERAGYRCRAARGADEALEAARSGEFLDAVVTDVVLGDDDRAGLRLLGALRAAGVHAPVVVITAYADVEKVKTALNEGAAHLLEKPFRAPDLLEALRKVQAHGATVEHTIEQVLQRARLTDKERAVARQLLEGLSSTEIAEISGNSPKTIRQHVSRIYEKCGVGNRAEFFRLVYPR